MTKYNIEYRDKSDFGCGITIEAECEQEAILKLVKILLVDNDYMSRLIDINKII